MGSKGLNGHESNTTLSLIVTDTYGSLDHQNRTIIMKFGEFELIFNV